MVLQSHQSQSARSLVQFYRMRLTLMDEFIIPTAHSPQPPWEQQQHRANLCGNSASCNGKYKSYRFRHLIRIQNGKIEFYHGACIGNRPYSPYNGCMCRIRSKFRWGERGNHRARNDPALLRWQCVVSFPIRSFRLRRVVPTDKNGLQFVLYSRMFRAEYIVMSWMKAYMCRTHAQNMPKSMFE